MLNDSLGEVTKDCRCPAVPSGHDDQGGRQKVARRQARRGQGPAVSLAPGLDDHSRSGCQLAGHKRGHCRRRGEPDDDRSHQEFLRAERAELYTQYVAAVDESRLLMEPFLRPGVLDIGAHFESLEIYAAPQSRETIAAIEEANRQVATVTAQIAVMGGGAATSAEQLKEDLEGTHRAIEMVYDCETYTPGSWICDEYMSDPLLDRSLTRFLSDREEFLAATRTQLATVD